MEKLPANPNLCNSTTLTKWADEMAKYLKSVDPNHLVGFGNEGFLSMASNTDWQPAKTEWQRDGSHGDQESIAKIKEIDFLTFHIYAKDWGISLNETERWSAKWIQMQSALAHKYNKPHIMEEFGWSDMNGPDDPKVYRNRLYDFWTHAVCKAGGNWMFWMMAAGEAWQDNDTSFARLYGDYDHYTVYYTSDISNGTNPKPTPSATKMMTRIKNIAGRDCRDY